jgi:Flp pilus assembly protein TadB
MAQTKTAQTKTKRSKPAKKSRASSTTKQAASTAKRAKSKSRAKSRAKSTSTKAKAKSAQRNGNANGVANDVANGVGDGAKAVRDAVSSAGKEAGHAVSKARIPLLAGGAAVAGTVGGLVLGASRSGDKVLGIKLPRSKRVKLRSRDFSKAAKEVGRFGENVGELTTELRRAREGLAGGDGKQSSPIEVLLSSLTSRHN